MRERPWPIILMAAIFCLSPVFNVLWSASLAEWSLTHYLTNELRTAPLQSLLLWTLPVLVGYGIFRVRVWSYPAVLALLSMQLYFSYESSRTHPWAIHFGPLAAVYAVNLAVVSYFLIPAVRAAYFDRNLRWWERKPRYPVMAHGRLRRPGKREGAAAAKRIPVVIADIAEGGMLMRCRNAIQEGELISVSFVWKDAIYQAKGRVIHRHQYGRNCYGIQFRPEGTEQYESLIQLIRGLPDEGMHPVAEAKPWPKSFKTWARRLVRKHKGLVPDLPKGYLRKRAEERAQKRAEKQDLKSPVKKAA